MGFAFYGASSVHKLQCRVSWGCCGRTTRPSHCSTVFYAQWKASSMASLEISIVIALSGQDVRL